ncbi:tripartite tricarboxylate transporter TctB family protein [Roseobacter ponti]|uniref:Tripartite tricarboxylate transporter TctB family protein n=1 Tax=Roseobacter ponti TaxID=1891787 RepID=A0A858SQF4_9RHOB|nr:tripartite tricarboxylate transporter TctB family protein [Roseobacter ponti]QJF50610.1 tripartite tricarboxylate transporter TctB family protein [Roseobacter ponti]
MTTQTPHRRPGELVFALLIVVFSVAAFWQSYGISGFSGKTEPGVFPMLASGVMVFSGIAILVSAARQPGPAAQSPGFFAEVLTPRHIILTGLVLGYVLLMPVLGFIAASAVFLFCSFQFLWRKNPLLTLALTAGTLLLIWFIFREVFQVVLPRGTLFAGFL